MMIVAFAKIPANSCERNPVISGKHSPLVE